MTWPASDVDTTDCDADGDSPLSFRTDVNDLITKFNQLRNHVTTFMRGLLDDADAASARSTLGLGSAAVEPTTTFWSTGDVKVTFKTSADTGWVMMNDGSIGNASSGGTTRANADTEALFTHLWNVTVNADCEVSGGRGGSAAADFAANKNIALPKALGRNLAMAGSGSGLTSRALASIIGTETKSILETNVPAHTHSVPGLSVPGLSVPSLSVPNAGLTVSTVPFAGIGGGGFSGVLTDTTNGGPTVDSDFVTGSAATGTGTTGGGTTGTGTSGSGTGSGTAMDVMNPRTHANLMIKL